MNLFYRKEEMFAKVQEHLKFKNKNMPIYLEIDIKLQLVNNIPMGWKLEISNTKID